MTNTKDQDKKHTGKQGFASMPQKKVQEIARKGGESSHNGNDKQSNDSTKQNQKEDQNKTATENDNAEDE